MRNSVLLAATAIGLSMASPSAAAETLTFDDISSGGVIPNGYGGLNWQNFNYLNGTANIPGGYQNGTVSGDYVAYNAFANDALILESNSPFDLLSGYFTAAWNDGLTITVLGFSGASQIYSTSFIVNTSGPSLQTFNWTGLTSVRFSSSGGVDNPQYSGSGRHFALDNLSVNVAAVPEPGTWAMMLLGFGAVGFALRRRNHIPQLA